MTRRPSPRDRADARSQLSARRPDGRRERRGLYIGPLHITPIRVALLIALFGSVAYLLYALVVVRDTNALPMLSSGAAVLGIVFIALALAGAKGTLDAGREGATGRAFVLAIGGGIAAIIGFGCFAGAIILALVMQGG